MERTAAERRERRIRPLTQEEAEFAAEHFHLVYWYLGRRASPPMNGSTPSSSATLTP